MAVKTVRVFSGMVDEVRVYDGPNRQEGDSRFPNLHTTNFDRGKGCPLPLFFDYQT